MDLGKFCLSLSVKNIEASKTFYEKMGFEAVPGCGSVDDKWLILQNGGNMIGLFQEMFSGNIFTFNPSNVRTLQEQLKHRGLTLDKEANGDEGPAHIILRDPDGNVLMLDQI